MRYLIILAWHITVLWLWLRLLASRCMLLLIIANVELTEVQVLIAKLQAIVESRNAQT